MHSSANSTFPALHHIFNDVRCCCKPHVNSELIYLRMRLRTTSLRNRKKVLARRCQRRVASPYRGEKSKLKTRITWCCLHDGYILRPQTHANTGDLMSSPWNPLPLSHRTQIRIYTKYDTRPGRIKVTTGKTNTGVTQLHRPPVVCSSSPFLPLSLAMG